MKLKYKIHKITDKIFYLDFENRYDAGMFFLRYQEFYESSNPKFRNKAFTITEYMDWYVKNGPRSNKYTTIFNYPEDWAGFNIPSEVIEKVLSKGIIDINYYDTEMMKISNKLYDQTGYDNFYLIGGTGFDLQTISHEVAHGIFATNSAYKKEMKALVSALPTSHIKKINTWLSQIGYTKQVFVDETQAYLSTGYGENLHCMKKVSTKTVEQFYNVYKEYIKDIKDLKNYKHYNLK
jgi:hypothetical protein